MRIGSRLTSALYAHLPRAPRRGPRPVAVVHALEALEPRVLLAFSPTGNEQFLLELTNRMRMNPGGELALLLDDLSPIHSPDPSINAAIQFFQVSGELLSSQWATLSAVPPLAWNEVLFGAARAHNQLMIDQDAQAHVLLGEETLGERILDAGYDYSIVGENIYAFAESVFHGHAGFAIDWGDEVGGIQNPPGHRENIMSAEFREIGISVLGEGNPGTEVGPVVITQDFGDRNGFGNPFLLGVIFDDANANRFYGPTEGLGGVAVSVDGPGGQFTTTSMSAGGYQLQVPPGTYTVTFSGGPLPRPAVVGNVTIAANNKKLDLNADLLVPDMAVSGNNVTIADGDATPSAADLTDFLTADVNSGQVTRTFTITNAGLTALSFTGSPIVRVLGAHAGDFTVVSQPAGPVAPGAVATFQVQFDPSAPGTRSAAISIASNDPDENAYNFAVRGTGTGVLGSDLSVVLNTAAGVLQPPTTLVPGERVRVPLTLSNLGENAATGLFALRVYASTDGAFNPTGPGADTLLAAPPARPVFLGVGRSTPLFADFVVPQNVAPGEYFFAFEVVPGVGINDANAGNNAALTAAALDVALDFGRLPGRAAPVTLTRSIGGTPVTFRLAGPGFAEVSEDGGGGFSLELFDTTAASSLLITTPFGAVANLVGLTVHDSLRSVTARTTRLLGDATIDGTLGSMLIGDAGGDHTLTIGDENATRLPAALTFGAVNDLAIASAVPIRSLVAAAWTDSNTGVDANAVHRIAAPWIGLARIAGDFEAALLLSGVGAPPGRTLGGLTVLGDTRLASAAITGGVGALDFRGGYSGPMQIAGNLRRASFGAEGAATWAISGAIASIAARGRLEGAIAAASLGSLTATGESFAASIRLSDPAATLRGVWVRGILDEAAIRTAGGLGAVRVGAIRDSEVLAGVDPAGTGFDEVAGFASVKTLASFVVTGVAGLPANQPTFTRSLVGAARLGVVQLRAVDPVKDAKPLGVIAAERVQLYRRGTVVRFNVTDATPQPFDAEGDFTARVI